MNDYCVYIHTNRETFRCYIGLAKGNCKKRWGHQGYGYHNQKDFWDDIQKYGWDNFDHEILEDGLTKEEAYDREHYYINHFNSSNPKYGYNKTRRKIKCIETGVIYDSIQEAADALDRGYSSIYQCAAGYRKTCGGYHLEFF